MIRWSSQLVLLACFAATGLANTMWFHTNSQEKVSPFPNFLQAMEGYDAVRGDSFSIPDPGRRKQIFDPLYIDGGRTYLRTFIDEIVNNSQCDEDFSVTSFSNLTKFMDEKMKGYSLFLDDLFDEKVKSNVPPKLGNGIDEQDGEIVMGRAECITSTVTIAPFEKPVFTDKFKNALSALHHASRYPESLRSKKTAYAFFSLYGTHFMRSVKLGSKMVFWKKIGSNSHASEEKRNQLKKCISNVAIKSVSTAKGNLSSVYQEFAAKSGECDSTESEKIVGFNRGDDIPVKQMLISGVSPVKSMDSWITDAQKNPVPVQVELMKISYLFRDDWLDFLNFGDDSDPEKMYVYFEERLGDYCKKMLGPQCAIVPDDQDPQPITKKENRAAADQAKVSFATPTLQRGSVLVSGGFSGMDQDLSSLEDLVHGILIPHLPEPVGGHSLTAVGSVLYNCGGSTPWSFENHTIHVCNELDTSKRNPTWSATFKLPSEMKNFHFAFAIKTRIWFFDRASNLVYIIDTNTKKFTQHTLPFTVSNEMCISHLLSSIIAIDTNTGEVYTLEDESSPEIWSKVSLSIEYRYSPVCIAVDSNVFITGDGPKDLSQNFEVYHSKRRSVTLIPTFVHPRIGYNMFLMDGAPAAVGGMSRKAQLIFKSIEVYNLTTGHWHVHSLAMKTPRVWFALTQIS